MGVESVDWVDLVVGARAGDAVAAGELLRRFEPLVRATTSRLIDRGGVDDVVQSSLAVSLERLTMLRTPAAFPSWLRLIVRKQASLQRRRRRPLPLASLDGPVPDGRDPASVVQERAVADAVHLALGGLRDDDRRLLELRYLAGWSNSELARLLDVSDGALRKRLHDARQRLRPLLQHLNEETLMTDYTRYLDQIHDASLDVPPAPPLRRPGHDPTPTGLKIIDTIAPVRRGGTIEMVGPAGTGQLVVAVELLYRLGRTTNDVVCIAVGAAGATLGSQRDLGHLTTEPGVPGPAVVILTNTAAEAARAVATGATLAAGFAHAGSDVVLIVDEATVQAVALTALSDAAGLADEGAVTVVAVRGLDTGAPCLSPRPRHHPGVLRRAVRAAHLPRNRSRSVHLALGNLGPWRTRPAAPPPGRIAPPVVQPATLRRRGLHRHHRGLDRPRHRRTRTGPTAFLTSNRRHVTDRTQSAVSASGLDADRCEHRNREDESAMVARVFELAQPGQGVVRSHDSIVDRLVHRPTRRVGTLALIGRPVPTDSGETATHSIPAWLSNAAS
jgi:RNA polymerase sigma-70 factor (ECF subfamily)